MDLILAHKQCIRLAELAGLSLSAQTTFATAVSEVSRNSTGSENSASLTLYVSDKKEKIKYITAVLEDSRPGFSESKDEGFKYAKRLVQNINATISGNSNRIELNYRLPASTRIDDIVLEKWRINLNTDPAVSPYEEIKRKNRQLVEMAEKLRESEQQYRSLTDSLPIMIFSVNVAGDIIYANKWLEEYTGETLEVISNTKWRTIVPAEDFDDIWRHWLSMSGDPKSVIYPERKFRNSKTGEYRWHTGAATPILDDAGNLKWWNIFMVDVHAQKEVAETLKHNVQLKAIQEELVEKVNLLNHSNLQLEQFAYVTSHDLQEPLRKIGFYSDYLNKKYGSMLPQEAGVFFENLINSTDRMKLLIQDVLAYSTLRKDKFTTVDLAGVATETLEDLEYSITEKEAQVSVGPLPVITGNSRQLKQLFENLVSNSIKFSQPGIRPVISITGIVENDQLQLAFTDNGIGFEEQYLDKLFDLFQRLHTRDKYKGTGIGLALCKKIVEFHNGTISAKSQPDHGATFLITLPVEQTEI
jgi:PAS domain S-box-containing protein